MSVRPKREIKLPSIKTELPVAASKKWSNKEIETVLNCLMMYGHKNLEKIQEHLPGRSIENIKTFIRTAHDRSRKTTESNSAFDAWIDLCSPDGTPWKDCLQIAQVLKYLSVDGLLENHPLPASCEGIDFGLAYRLLYQAVMGYPIQPVNKPTADFVIGSLMELNDEIKKQTTAIQNMKQFLANKSKTDESGPSGINTENLDDDSKKSSTVKKPLKVYQRKKPKLTNTEVEPSLRITVEDKNCNSGLGSLKDFSVTVERNNSCQSTTVNVPVPCKLPNNEDELELLKTLSYNPLKIPEKWLKEPLYLN